MKTNKKRIKILSTGMIKVHGFINGPVLTPYYEDISVIIKMLTAGVKVVEVADNGAETLLTVSSVLADSEKQEKEQIEEVKVEETVEEVAEEVVEEVKVEEPETSDEQVMEENVPTTQKNTNNNYNYKKNNKHKK